MQQLVKIELSCMRELKFYVLWRCTQNKNVKKTCQHIFAKLSSRLHESSILTIFWCSKMTPPRALWTPRWLHVTQTFFLRWDKIFPKFKKVQKNNILARTVTDMQNFSKVQKSPLSELRRVSKVILFVQTVNKHMGFLMVISSRLHESSILMYFSIIFGKKGVQDDVRKGRRITRRQK